LFFIRERAFSLQKTDLTPGSSVLKGEMLVDQLHGDFHELPCLAQTSRFLTEKEEKLIRE
jgi:hypothetical protein